MASLLAKFRIDYSDLKVIPDITKKPKETTVAFFDSLISEFKQLDVNTDNGMPTDPSKYDCCTILFLTDCAFS